MILSRALGILFFGFLFALAPIAIALGGILEGYIHFHEIKDCGRRVFFNPFFYDTIFHKGHAWIFVLSVLLAGWLVMYPPFLGTFFRFLYAFLLIMSVLFFMPSVGLKAGAWLFEYPHYPIRLITGEQKQLHVIYLGREGVHFLDPNKPFPLTYRWEDIQGGEEQRCYRTPSTQTTPSTPSQIPDTRGASPQEAAAVGVEPLPEKKSMFDVLMQKLFPSP